MTTTDGDAVRDEIKGLATERVNERYSTLDEWSTLRLVQAMNDEDAGVAHAVAEAAEPIAEAVDAIAARMAEGGRLLYLGAGTPGRLGVLDASEIPPTFGLSPDRVVGVIAGGDTAIRTAVEGAEDDADLGAHDVSSREVGSHDAVVGISASGRTPYVLGALREAADRGALTVGLSCNSDSPLGAAADIAIEVVVGPELVSGSTRLKAGTAQKMVLNMLSTLTMIRRGKTYGNLMVDVQITNAKLRARAERTVALATGCELDEAARALSEADCSVKLAILLILSGLPVNAARKHLDDADGFLRTALESARES